MNPRRQKLPLVGYLALACIAAFSAHAASIDGQAHKGYGRINFHFSSPAKLKAQVSDTRAVLVFDQPLGDTPEAIRAALPGYVTAAQLSADKRTLTLTLSQTYRLRQFVTGTGVGVDFLGTPADTSTTAEAPRPPTAAVAAASTKTAPAEKAKPTATAPLPSLSKAVKPTPRKEAASAAADDAMFSTKATTPAKAVEATAPLLTTKAAPAAIETTKAPAPANDAIAETTVPTPAAKAEPEATAAKPEEVKPEIVAPEAVTAAPETGPFVITAKTANGETTLNFPWGSRTGAAVFRRGQDIWLVFSQEQDANIPLLRGILPRQVVNVIQYAYPHNTVLRLVTDGNLFARAEQVKGRYGWNIILGTNAGKPLLDIPVTADTLEENARLVLGAFDVAPELRFYDPNAGDALVVIPAFENGRGVAIARDFPELSVLASPQGIALINRRGDLTLARNRAGLILGGSDGLAISENLPLLADAAPIVGRHSDSGILLPYDLWYVDQKKYRETEITRLHAVTTATRAGKAEAMLELVKLYLSSGFGSEAAGVLTLLREQFPQYYAANKLALLSAAAHVLDNHMRLAAQDLQAPELNSLEEAALWRELVALYAPPLSAAQALQQALAQQTPVAGSDSAANLPIDPAAPPAPPPPPAIVAKPVFHFLKYNKSFIRFYPPRIRQHLARLAAEAYIADNQPEKALAAYDSLVPDDLLGPVRFDAEYALGAVAVEKKQFDQAYEIFDRLAKQIEDRRIAIRARYAAALLRYANGKITGDEAAEILESTRMAWRGDAIDRSILQSLITIYTDGKRYGDVLRTYKAILEGFPGDPETLSISGQLSELFERVFLDGLADDLTPLNSLALFYEFRDLTPLGEKGDKMIQNLADRLAAIDLLERATQLLENQIKFRSTGAVRSQIGARLALLYLLDHHPQEALNVLEVTNYGGNEPPLQAQRRQLTAQALTRLGKHAEALGVITGDNSAVGALLRLDILWALKDWPNVVNHAEDILNARPNLTDPLSATETEVLLKLALGYAFEGDYVQLRYLRDYYSGLIPDSGYKQIFDYITNDTTPLDPEDFALLAEQISRTEGFLDTFRASIAAGKLSEAVK
ncbi:MAG: hypothetical protein SFW64_07715 [Alphaproteobacteria bacterium]|nr:hypothetical protein [Alphaproteobacteria bacterium]